MEQPSKKLLELARLLSPSDLSLIEELETVIEDFEEEDVRYKQIADDTGIYAIEIESETMLDLAWDALENGLLERNRLVEIELRESPEDVALNIDQLLIEQPPDPNRWRWFKPGDHKNDFPHVFLKEVHRRVFSPEKILARLEGKYLDNNYMICLIDASKYKKVEELVQEISYGRIQKVEDLDVKGVF
jgi:hypothetical protein